MGVGMVIFGLAHPMVEIFRHIECLNLGRPCDHADHFYVRHLALHQLSWLLDTLNVSDINGLFAIWQRLFMFVDANW